MKPGRELDILIAEKIMGWKMGDFGIAPPGFVAAQDYFEKYKETQFSVPNYSTDIKDAFKVLEHFQYLKIINITWDAPTGDWYVSFNTELSWDQTLPGAICLAALKVYE